MNINSVNSTPAFKGDYDYNTEVIPVERYEIIEQPDEFISKTKKNPEEKIMQGVKAATVGGVAIPTALAAGSKIADKIEKIAIQFCDDFADDAAKKAREELTGKGVKNVLGKIKNFSTNAITELPKRGKSLIKWGFGGAIASALIYLGTKDDNKDGQSDLLTAVKTYIAPGDTPLLEQ